MTSLPQFVLLSRELANEASDAHSNAWESLQALKAPGIKEIERWLEVRHHFHRAQERFEVLLQQFLAVASPR